MFYINDRSLEEIKPSSLSWDDFKKDCESFNKGGYHSDEISETDDDLAKEEITARIRPKNKKDTDKHVLHVYDKPWRSGRVNIWDLNCILLLLCIYFFFFKKNQIGPPFTSRSR